MRGQAVNHLVKIVDLTSGQVTRIRDTRRGALVTYRDAISAMVARDEVTRFHVELWRDDERRELLEEC